MASSHVYVTVNGVEQRVAASQAGKITLAAMLAGKTVTVSEQPTTPPHWHVVADGGPLGDALDGTVAIARVQAAMLAGTLVTVAPCHDAHAATSKTTATPPPTTGKTVSKTADKTPARLVQVPTLAGMAPPAWSPRVKAMPTKCSCAACGSEIVKLTPHVKTWNGETPIHLCVTCMPIPTC